MLLSNSIRNFVIKNVTMISVLTFLGLYVLILLTKPSFIWDNDSLRQFGLGTRKKTILPLWLVVIVTAILCYLGVLYYINYNRFN